MSIIPTSQLALDDCLILGNNTLAAVLRDSRRSLGTRFPRRRWHFRPLPRKRGRASRQS